MPSLLFFVDNLSFFLDSYVLKLEKADVYRLPYLSSSGPGFGLYFTFALSTLTHESPGLTHKDQGTALLALVI